MKSRFDKPDHLGTGPGAAMTRIVAADFDNPLHAAAIVGLLDEYASGPTGGGRPLSPFARNELVSQLRARPTIHVLLAVADERAVGLAICIEGFSTFACKPLLNIHDLAVTQDFRGRGIGRMLLEEAEARARELGCCKLTLEVLGGNDNAQRLYRSCGYAPYELDPAVGKAMLWQRAL
jgi:ribosomal protein S18 acetylase RimI-like enzyme